MEKSSRQTKRPPYTVVWDLELHMLPVTDSAPH